MKSLFALAMLLSSLTAVATPLANIDELTWQNRIILIWSDSTEPFSKRLEQAQAEIADRDIVWFVFANNEVATNYQGALAGSFAEQTTRQFRHEPRQVLLIGKDGGIKERDTELLLDSLFREIDTMPMRINEMRAQR